MTGHGYHWSPCRASARGIIGGFGGTWIVWALAAAALLAAWEMWHWLVVVVPVLVVAAFLLGKRAHRPGGWSTQQSGGWPAPEGTSRRVRVQHQLYVEHEVDVIHSWQVNDPGRPLALPRPARALSGQPPVIVGDWSTVQSRQAR